MLDGNAIAGELYELLGCEVTTLTGLCSGCGQPSMVGELLVYMRAPGAVVRCPHCGAVAMVLVGISGETRLTMAHFHLPEVPGAPAGLPA